MKILEPGPEYRLPWAYVTECARCHTKVELELADAKRGDEGGYSESIHCIYWDCPYCGNQPNFPKAMYKVLEYHRPELKARRG
jgi:hypothetical protein